MNEHNRVRERARVNLACERVTEVQCNTQAPTMSMVVDIEWHCLV
jgi:hypothetical protein